MKLNEKKKKLFCKIYRKFLKSFKEKIENNKSLGTLLWENLSKIKQIEPRNLKKKIKSFINHNLKK